MPWPSQTSVRPPFLGDSCVKTVALSACQPCQKSWPECDSSASQSIYVSGSPLRICPASAELFFQLSIPSPLCFTSGEQIPFILSLIFPDAPALPALLTPDIRIELIGRLRLSRIGSTEVATRERVIGTADIQSISEPTEGIAYLRGTIQAGKAGRGSSWKVFGMADIQVSWDEWSLLEQSG